MRQRTWYIYSWISPIGKRGAALYRIQGQNSTKIFEGRYSLFIRTHDNTNFGTIECPFENVIKLIDTFPRKYLTSFQSKETWSFYTIVICYMMKNVYYLVVPDRQVFCVYSWTHLFGRLKIYCIDRQKQTSILLFHHINSVTARVADPSDANLDPNPTLELETVPAVKANRIRPSKNNCIRIRPHKIHPQLYSFNMKVNIIEILILY